MLLKLLALASKLQTSVNSTSISSIKTVPSVTPNDSVNNGLCRFSKLFSIS